MKKLKCTATIITMLLLIVLPAHNLKSESKVLKKCCKEKQAVPADNDDYYNGTLQSILLINKAI